jgi:hypothetical protein
VTRDVRALSWTSLAWITGRLARILVCGGPGLDVGLKPVLVRRVDVDVLREPAGRAEHALGHDESRK